MYLGTEDRSRRGSKQGLLNNWKAVFLCLAVTMFSVANGIILQLPKESALPSDQIGVLEMQTNDRLRRPKVSDRVITLENQNEIPEDRIRQYSYLFETDLEHSSDLRIIAPEIGGTVQVYFNGVGIGQEQRRPYVLLGQIPAYVDLTIPSVLFQPGLNRLEFIVTPDEWGGQVSDLYVQPAMELDYVANRLLAYAFVKPFWTATAIIVLTVALLGIILFRIKRGYVLFGVVGLILFGKSALSPAANFSMGLPVSIVAITLESVLLLIAFVLFVSGKRSRPQVEIGLFITALLAAGLAICSFLFNLKGSEISLALPLVALGILPFFAFRLASQFQNDVVEARLFKVQMAKKLAAAEQVIIDQREQLNQQIKKRAQMEERQRLTRDIHDGIGGHLLSLLVRVKSGDASTVDIEKELQAGLNDLRLIVDSMDHSSDDLESALNTFHARARPQLTASNITLNWILSTPFAPGRYGPKIVLNLYRFMQEAITNTVRHSRADTLLIDLRCAAPADPLRVYIADNGTGIDDLQNMPAGQGLKNMRARANNMDAGLTLGLPKEGTGLAYTLLIPPASVS